MEGGDTMQPPLTQEERLSLELWIQEEQIEISQAEKHFRLPLPDDHEMKLRLAELESLRQADDDWSDRHHPLRNGAKSMDIV